MQAIKYLSATSAVLICLALLGGCSPTQATNELETKPLTQGLNHVGLSVRDLKNSREFFVETLGWRVVGGYPDYPSSFVTDCLLYTSDAADE